MGGLKEKLPKKELVIFIPPSKAFYSIAFITITL